MILNSSGCRNATCTVIKDTIMTGTTVEESNIVPERNDEDLTIPTLYQQESVSVENSCVWLATCLVVRSVDDSLSNVLIQQYHADRPQYEWLHIFNK